MKSRDASVEREKLDGGELSRRELGEFSPPSSSLFCFLSSLSSFSLPTSFPMCEVKKKKNTNRDRAISSTRCSSACPSRRS